MQHGTNPLTGMDHPDPDVIRVNDTYYMICTTMHFFPGGEILRSYDLVNWEPCTYLFDTLEHTAGERLEGDNTIYGHGMWAASLRFHNGKFYAVFIAHEWDKTFLFTADKIEGPWSKSYIEGIYHDPSLLFDDDGRKYIVYGNREIHLTELNDGLSAPRAGGTDRIIVRDSPDSLLGYEGSHIYKINGKYLLFLIHSGAGEWYRTEACFIADDLNGEWTGGEVLRDDLDGLHSGPAQGGIVDTPDGRWFSVVFQDRGAVGRVPVLVPVTFDGNGFPVFGKVTKEIANISTRENYKYAPFCAGDKFTSQTLAQVWQFNHEPFPECFTTGGGCFTITTNKLSRDLEHARNTITQRTSLPSCAAEVTLNAECLNNGDTAGLCVLIGNYALIGVTGENDRYFLVMRSKTHGCESQQGKVPLTDSSVRLRAEVRFENSIGRAEFFYMNSGKWQQLGIGHELFFALDHFTGARFGLFMYSQEQTGGAASFSDFEYLHSL